MIIDPWCDPWPKMCILTNLDMGNPSFVVILAKNSLYGDFKSPNSTCSTLFRNPMKPNVLIILCKLRYK